MVRNTAIWFPYWYELDQSIEVGVEGEFHFFKTPPPSLAEPDHDVFYNGLWESHASVVRHITIRSIRNICFGDVQKINAVGLDYRLTFPDGRTLKIDAEESPGAACDWPEPITDWRFYVDLDLAD
ncbi:MAG: hypothetical protein ACI9HK_006152 [Pirellulaceae bacterium]|jgi:hypothetical protein